MQKQIIIDQDVAFNIIKNGVLNNSVSHAYLINTNGYHFAFGFALEMAKSFLCSNHINEFDCIECDICRRIDNGNYPEFKVIEADGLWIKKNQIVDLQDEFNKIALEGNIRVYVIKDADKMNHQTSNSLLKFLEEPNNNIIAILMTDNINKILNTIVSRCQVINLKNNNINGKTAIENMFYLFSSDCDFDVYINDKSNIDFLNSVVSFVEYFENNKLFCLVKSKNIWHSKFKNREDVLKCFDLLINFYYDVLIYKNCNSINFFVDYYDLIISISNKNSLNDIMKKLNVCIEFKDKIIYNLNLNLFYDNFIIELGG